MQALPGPDGHGKDSFDTNNHLGAGFQKVPRSLGRQHCRPQFGHKAAENTEEQNTRGTKERKNERRE